MDRVLTKQGALSGNVYLDAMPRVPWQVQRLCCRCSSFIQLSNLCSPLILVCVLYRCLICVVNVHILSRPRRFMSGVWSHQFDVSNILVTQIGMIASRLYDTNIHSFNGVYFIEDTWHLRTSSLESDNSVCCFDLHGSESTLGTSGDVQD